MSVNPDDLLVEKICLSDSTDSDSESTSTDSDSESCGSEEGGAVYLCVRTRKGCKKSYELCCKEAVYDVVDTFIDSLKLSIDHYQVELYDNNGGPLIDYSSKKGHSLEGVDIDITCPVCGTHVWN